MDTPTNSSVAYCFKSAKIIALFCSQILYVWRCQKHSTHHQKFALFCNRESAPKKVIIGLSRSCNNKPCHSFHVPLGVARLHDGKDNSSSLGGGGGGPPIAHKRRESSGVRKFAPRSSRAESLIALLSSYAAPGGRMHAALTLLLLTFAYGGGGGLEPEEYITSCPQCHRLVIDNNKTRCCRRRRSSRAMGCHPLEPPFIPHSPRLRRCPRDRRQCPLALTTQSRLNNI